MFGITSPQTQIEKGREAVTWFHNHAARYSTYNHTLDSLLLAICGNNDLKVTNFLDGLGTAIDSVESYGFLWDSKVKTAMENLADKGAGKIPTMQSFFNALNDSAQDVSWVDTTVYATKETVKTVIEGVAEVGDSVIATGKILNFLLPAVAVSAILYIALKRTKQIAG